MNGKEIVKDIMNKNNVSNSTLASRLNISQPTLWDRLNNKNVKDISIPLLTDILRSLDYKLTIVPRSKRLNDDEYEVNQ